jgi:O-antigen/teichoic acid export membrane protein
MGFGAASFAALAVLSVGSSIAVARIYGIRVLGEYALVMAAVNAVTVLSSARERPGLVRELAKLPPRAPRVTALFLPVLAFSAALTLVVSGLVLAGAWLVYRGPVGRPELLAPAAVAVAGFLCFENTSANIDGVLTSFRAGAELFWVRLAQALALLAISVALGALGADVWGLVAATVASQASALGHRLAICRRYLEWRVSRAELRAGARELPDIVRFGLKIAPGSLADGASNEMATWVLGVTARVAVVGAYSRAWMITRQLMYLNVRVTEMLFPTLVERRHRGDMAGFERALYDTLRYSAAGLLAIPAAAGGAAAGIMALFGPGFGAASHALAVLLCVPALLTLTQVQRHALYALDRPLVGTASAGLRLVVTAGACIPLAVASGPTGAAAGVVAGLLADLAFTTVQAARRLPSPVRRLVPVRELAGLACGGAAGYGVAHAVYAAAPNPGGLLLALGAGVVVYAAAVLAVGGLRERDVARLRDLQARAGRLWLRRARAAG